MIHILSLSNPYLLGQLMQVLSSDANKNTQIKVFQSIKIPWHMLVRFGTYR